MGVLAENSALQQALADLPRGAGRGRDVDPDPESDLAQLGDRRKRMRTQPFGGVVAKLSGVGSEATIPEQAKHFTPDGARQRVASEGAPVLTRPEDAEHLIIGENRGQRQDPPSESLAEHETGRA